MTLLGSWLCTKVDEIVINARGQIRIEGQRLDPLEADLLCWRDGFRAEGSTADNPRASYALFWEYWQVEAAKEPKRAFPFVGDLIHWKFDEKTREPMPPHLSWACVCGWFGKDIRLTLNGDPTELVAIPKCTECGRGVSVRLTSELIADGLRNARVEQMKGRS